MEQECGVTMAAVPVAAAAASEHLAPHILSPCRADWYRDGCDVAL